MSGATLAIDLGGTKILAALVEGARIVDRREAPTGRGGTPDDWLHQIRSLAAPWAGRYDRAGIAVTGVVADGLWRTTNRSTLDILGAYPLAAQAAAALGIAPTIGNDAQAAAWGEYRHGAGRGRDMIFLTVSTGIGGGVILGGRLVVGRHGLAGHGGLMTGPEGAASFEELASGQGMASAARAAGQANDARGVFAAARDGAGWAESIVAGSARGIAALCHDIQALLAPEVVVIGGGVGLAEGYLDRIRSHLSNLPDLRRPDIVAAALGADAGVIGIADLADLAEAAGPSRNAPETVQSPRGERLT